MNSNPPFDAKSFDPYPYQDPGPNVEPWMGLYFSPYQLMYYDWKDGLRRMGFGCYFEINSSNEELITLVRRIQKLQIETDRLFTWSVYYCGEEFHVGDKKCDIYSWMRFHTDNLDDLLWLKMIF